MRTGIRHALPGLLLALIVPVSVHATASGCAVVMATPDGFLNLRDAPTMGSKVHR